MFPIPVCGCGCRALKLCQDLEKQECVDHSHRQIVSTQNINVYDNRAANGAVRLDGFDATTVGHLCCATTWPTTAQPASMRVAAAQRCFRAHTGTPWGSASKQAPAHCATSAPARCALEGGEQCLHGQLWDVDGWRRPHRLRIQKDDDDGQRLQEQHRRKQCVSLCFAQQERRGA